MSTDYRSKTGLGVSWSEDIFPEEKTLIEAVTADHIKRQTQVFHDPYSLQERRRIGQRMNTIHEYYSELVDLYLAQLVCQHKDLVASGDACRNNYVARSPTFPQACKGRSLVKL